VIKDLKQDEEALHYAESLYSYLLATSCPGDTGHEGKNVRSVYCDRCITLALSFAWKAGRDSVSPPR
jgi:hypothetical protein